MEKALTSEVSAFTFGGGELTLLKTLSTKINKGRFIGF
jgi:hypothetical protein